MLFVLCALTLGAPLSDCPPARPTSPPVLRVATGAVAIGPDSLAVVRTVEAFHAALIAGDSTAALALLAADAVVLEAGGRESREEYRTHHLPADITFAGAVPSERGPLRVTLAGASAWVVGESRSRGTFRGREINSAGVELMVLSRAEGQWLIRAIHWSSRNVRD